MEGRPILAPPCWGYVQFQLTECMMSDQKLTPEQQKGVDTLRRQILGVPDTGAIPPEKLKNFWAVCSTAIVNVAKKVAFVELRTHERATIDPGHAAVQLRELFHSYLTQNGEVQVGERAPAPMSRDIRTALTAMGYAKGGGKGKT